MSQRLETVLNFIQKQKQKTPAQTESLVLSPQEEQPASKRRNYVQFSSRPTQSDHSLYPSFSTPSSNRAGLAVYLLSLHVMFSIILCRNLLCDGWNCPHDKQGAVASWIRRSSHDRSTPSRSTKLASLNAQ